MDNPKEFTVLEWCAGYGGIQLGLRRVIPNMRTIAYSEIEAFACSNLVAKMGAGELDAAPIWTDLKTFPCREFHGKVDLLVAGYPCQPFSAAGKRQGADDPRHLWPHIREAIRIIQPRQCFFENVEGHITLGLSTVLSDLEEDGYTATWGIFSAEEVGAPHRRKRVFILADRKRQRPQRHSRNVNRPQREQIRAGRPVTESSLPLWPSRPNEPQYDWEPPRVVVDSEGSSDRRIVRNISEKDASLRQSEEQYKDEVWKSESASSKANKRKAKPSMGRDPDGSSGGLGYAELCESCDNRTDELRLLGNGVVPATVTKAWVILTERLNNA